MSIINKGTAFSNGEQLSANKLNDLLDAATFGIDSVDNASTIVNANGAITVRDSGVTAAKLATGAVTASKILDANVTKAKIENVADYKVLGNVSGAAAAPAEVAILDEDDMTSDSDTALATQQSIKAYVNATAGIVQSALAEDGTSQTITATIPADNSIPQITEGVQVLSLTITPKSTSNRMKVLCIGNIIHSSATGQCTVALFEGNTCVGASTWNQASSGIVPVSMQFYFNPSSTSETIYTIRIGPSSGSIFFNSYGTLGGLNKSKFYIEELSL